MIKKFSQFFYNARVGRFRSVVQVLSIVLFIYGGYFTVNWVDQLPTFACAFAEKRVGSCYLLGLQHQMALPWTVMMKGAIFGVLTSFATFLLFFLVLNKAWCGFICPLGTLQDWITALRKRIGLPYSTYSETAFERLSKIKYILLLLLILIPMAIGNSFFGLPKLNHDFGVPFCMICPGRTLLPLFTGDTSELMIDFSSLTKMVLSALGIVVTALFLVGSFVKKRFFCLFCPMSALHYLFSRASILRLSKQGDKCTRCGDCYKVCDMGIREIADDIEHKNILQDDCMMCFKCIEACPEEDCLKASFLGLPIYKSTEEGFFLRTGKKNEPRADRAASENH